MSKTAPEWSADACERSLQTLPPDERFILPALQQVQRVFGFVPVGSEAVVAQVLNVSVADVHGVLTFYHDLRTSAPAPITLCVCVAEACQARGSNLLVDHVEAAIAPIGGRSADGVVDVKEVFCLGNCALGPAVLVGTKLHGRVSPESLDGMLNQDRAEVRA